MLFVCSCRRSTCTQKCPKALHFIPTILCIDCEMKFHPQCEGITLEDESDFEDLTPIVDYICKVSLIICEFKHSVLMNILK